MDLDNVNKANELRKVLESLRATQTMLAADETTNGYMRVQLSPKVYFENNNSYNITDGVLCKVIYFAVKQQLELQISRTITELRALGVTVP